MGWGITNTVDVCGPLVADVVDGLEVADEGDKTTANVPAETGVEVVLFVVCGESLSVTPLLFCATLSPSQTMGQEGISTFKLEGTQLHMRRVEPVRNGRLRFVV